MFVNNLIIKYAVSTILHVFQWQFNYMVNCNSIGKPQLKVRKHLLNFRKGHMYISVQQFRFVNNIVLEKGSDVIMNCDSERINYYSE